MNETMKEIGPHCPVDSDLRECARDERGRLIVFGQREYDVGACGGWTRFMHRMSNLPARQKVTVAASSRLGAHCTFGPGQGEEEHLPKCLPKHFLSPLSPSDFGR